MTRAAHSRGLWLIAAFKLLKGLVLLAVGIGALKLLHRDVASEVQGWIDLIRVDPDNFYIHKALMKISALDDRQLKHLSVGTFIYSALLLTEGIGLSLQKRWAEYLTIVITASLIPLEVYEIVKQVSTAKIIVLLINIAVVVYLIWVVRIGRKESREGD